MKNSSIWEKEFSAKCDFCDSNCIRVIDDYSNVAKCEKCGFIFVNKRPQQSDIDKLYPEGHYAAWYEGHSGRKAMWEKRCSFINNWIGGGKCLDIGCGDGYFLSLLKKRGFEVQGTEISAGAVKFAKENYGLNIYHGDVTKAGYNPDTFDVVTLWHVLEHVPSPSSVLMKVKELCKPGGYLLIAVPNLYNWEYYLKIPLRKKHFHHLSEANEIHLSYFSKMTLSNYLKKYRFEIIHFGPDDYYPSPCFRTGLRYIFNSFITAKFRLNMSSTIRIVAQNNK